MDGESLPQQPDVTPALVDGPAPGALGPGEPLFVPHRKRLAYEYVVTDGVRELRLDYGRKEIFFDEPRLFAFGEQLTREPAFTGARAMAWGPGYAWPELQPLLETLLDEGILQRGDPASEPRVPGGLVASHLPPSVCPAPRFWSLADAEPITRDLAGHAVELGHLEVFLPIYRVAHAALDADDRQVGEGNVNPWLLRLDRDIEWRVCQYPGSRYRDEMPMNVTALKAMIRYWKPMMATLGVIRGEVARRLAITGPRWTLGELHVLACAVLALPAYPLMRHGGTTPPRPVDPVLSSLFRITDGVRMTTSDMVTSIARPCSATLEVTGEQLYARAEQDGLFISKAGVCAGPRHMIDELLAIAVDGAPAPGVTGDEIPDGVRALLGELPDAIDYACYGLQLWALAFSTWLAMTEAHEQLVAILDPTADEVLLPRLHADARAIAWKQIADDRERAIHLALYVDTWRLARAAARAPIGAPALATELEAAPATDAHAAAAARLRDLLAGRVPHHARIVDVIVTYARAEQAILTAMAPLVDAVNTVLARPRPIRPLSGRDLAVHHRLRGTAEHFPYLFDSLEAALGLRITVTAGAIEIDPR